jgi:hypothetical protein
MRRPPSIGRGKLGTLPPPSPISVASSASSALIDAKSPPSSACANVFSSRRCVSRGTAWRGRASRSCALARLTS